MIRRTSTRSGLWSTGANSEDTGESHTIGYQGGKIRVAERMTGQQLGPMNRFFRGALFPLIVVILVVYLASQTLLGK